ncbi:MAG: hypothetical protein WCY93_08905 [Anaerolineaceae bacterium]
MIFGITWTSIFQTISQITAAGAAITALSLLLFALIYNLREQVVRAFILILLCVVVFYTAETIASVNTQAVIIDISLKIKWVGIVFLPASYLYFSNALLTLTGRPSRGRRLWLVRAVFLFSLVLCLLIPLNILVGPLDITGQPTPHLERTLYTGFFALYYVGVMVIAGSILYRAFQRTVTKTSRRRMIYLLLGATVAAVGIFPYSLFGSGLFSQFPILFWIIVSIANLLVGGFLVIISYSVAFFGVSWPDRLVKGRLFKWFLRGPLTASIVLASTTIIRRFGMLWDDPYNPFVPIFMVGLILIMEYSITLLAPFWERLLFYGSDRREIMRIQSLEDHMLTRSDLQQFLEIVTATLCDLLQVKSAFISMMDGGGLMMLTVAGNQSAFTEIESSDEVLALTLENGTEEKKGFLRWSGHLLIPLVYDDQQNGRLLLGLCGFPWENDREMDAEHVQSINLLTTRVSIALRDWKLQQQVIDSLESLHPQVALIQQLRAASSYNKTSVLLDEVQLPEEDFIEWVKGALTHYWGGPKLTESPLLGLQIVQSAIDDYDGSPINALRGILKTAIDNIKPEGERRFTAEWILYNILELKFLEGRKVREVANRLAMSEADLYRKQRIALEAVSKTIVSMELSEREKEQT